jgi:hypothetical protein
MQQDSGEVKAIEVLLKAASFFLAGFLFLSIIFPPNFNTLGVGDRITFVVGILICFFGFLLAVTAIPVKSKNERWNKWVRKMNNWATGGYSVVFAAVVLQLTRYIFVYEDIEILRIISIIFLLLFGLLFIATLAVKSSVFHSIKGTSLFILALAIYSIITVMTEQIEIWGLLTLFTIIMLSSARVWHLERKREETESKNK